MMNVPVTATTASSSRVDARALTLAICLLSNVFAGMLATLMSAYLPDSVRDLTGTADAVTMGHVGSYVGSLFLIGWALGGVGFGWAADRFGRAHTFTAAVLLFAVATLAASRSVTWPMLVVCRMATGIGIGGTMVVSAILVAEDWHERARAIAMGFLGVSFPIGIISAGAVSYRVAGWRTGFLAGLLPLALGLIAMLVVRDSAHWLTDHLERRRTGGDSPFRSLVSPDNRRNFLLGATIFGTMSVGLWATFSWLPAWAQDLVGTAEGGQRQRGMLMMVLGSGGIVGGALSGFLANALGRRNTLLVSFAGSFLASALLLLGNSTITPLVFAETAFLAVFFGISQGTLGVYIPELFPIGVRATGTGVCFNVGRVVTALAVFFIGVLVPVLGGYGNAISAFSVMYLFGLLAIWFGRETRGVSQTL
ncbi:MAG: transporter [Gemmatimonadetes bacterium]|nr:transporter [Gemmatimonadota bacterium]